MDRFTTNNFSWWLQLESDPRVDNWPLMSSPYPTIAICASFLASAKLLHFWMANRKPISIRWPIWCFDVFHLLVSTSLILVSCNMKLLRDFNFR